jgi:predicted dehydrogenase
MARMTRRRFFKNTLAAAATITLAGTKSSGRVLGANEVIRVAIAGLNGRGGAHVGALANMQGVQITYLVDPDTRTYARRTGAIRGNRPQTVQDVRRALEDRNVDAVSIATPNHWHALMTIWAAQAGKHVYVEKPCSHNIHEGRIAVEIARRQRVIVQHGTQSRSSQQWANVVEILRAGTLGRLKVARALCYKGRTTIGTRPNSDAPAELDFNLWQGPAQRRPFHLNLVHYNWHWFWDFGNGDIGNQGVHQMDIARWGIPNATWPRSVICVGGRFGYSDQGETPNTQVALFDYGDTKLIFEVRGLPSDRYRNESIGNIFHLDEGVIAGNRFYPRGRTEGQPLPQLQQPAARGPGGGDHFANWIAAIRSNRQEDLNANLLEGHYSSGLCHLANISYRLGAPAGFQPRARALGESPDLVETLDRMEEHLRGRDLDLANLRLQVGRKLEFDAQAENFGRNEEANRLLTRQYREGFVVPERAG